MAGIIPITPAQSIEDAMLFSDTGDTVLLADGLYSESVFITGKKITVGSQFLLDGDTAHISATIVERDLVHPDTQSCFIIVDCPDTVRLVGLTIRNGLGTMWSEENAYAGGCVYSLLSKVIIEHCTIRSGTAAFGGGIFTFRRANQSVNSLSLRNCVVTNCASDYWGGGVYANRCTLEVRNSTVRNCFSLSQSGGGISAPAPAAIIENCTFDSCAGIVGGVDLGVGSAIVRGCTFTNNTATLIRYSAHLGGGGGFRRIEGNYFGPTLSNTVGVRFCCDTEDSVFFVGNILEYNEATVRTGSLYSAGVAGEISHNIFRWNIGSLGSQIYCFQGTTVDIHHNVFEGNISLDPSFPSVLLTGPNARQQFHDNILVGNSGGTIDYNDTYHTTIDARNNWWGHASGPYHPTQNPGGQGDTLLSDSVLFDPWLMFPPDTSSSSVGRPLPVSPVNWELLIVYPNPFNSELSISIAGIMGQGFSLKLYDTLGREVATLREGRGHGTTLHYSAPPTLAAGVYFLCAAEGNFVETRKVVFLK